MGDKRTDSGQFYPGGKVIPRQPVRPGGGADPNAVHYTAETKTEAQKAQARENIGAGTSNFSGDYNALENVPQSFPPSAHADAHGENGADAVTIAQSQVTGLGDALEAKRDKTDEAAYDNKVKWFGFDRNSGSSSEFIGEYPPLQGYSSSYNLSGARIAFRASEGKVYGLMGSVSSAPVDALDEDGASFSVTIPGWDLISFTRRESFVDESQTHVIARRSASAASALAKFDANGNLVAATGGTDFVAPVAGKGLSQNDYMDEDKAEVAKVEDKADEFLWVPDTEVAPGQPEYNETDQSFEWKIDTLVFKTETGVPKDFTGEKEFFYQYSSFTATRKRILRTGDAATPQDVAAKLDTSKAVPAYSASLTYEVGEIVLHDGSAYKCTTAITTTEAWTAAHWTAATDAEISARLNGFKADGSVTDAFAADLLGKPVAKEALSKGYAFFDLVPVTEGGFKVFAAKDHAINRFTLADATPVKVILPNATDANGRDFILKVNVTSATMPTFEIVKPSDAASVGIEAADDGWADLEAGINYFTITETDRA